MNCSSKLAGVFIKGGNLNTGKSIVLSKMEGKKKGNAPRSQWLIKVNVKSIKHTVSEPPEWSRFPSTLNMDVRPWDYEELNCCFWATDIEESFMAPFTNHKLVKT